MPEREAVDIPEGVLAPLGRAKLAEMAERRDKKDVELELGHAQDSGQGHATLSSQSGQDVVASGN